MESRSTSPSQRIDRRRNANLPRRITSYNAYTLNLHRRSITARPKKSRSIEHLHDVQDIETQQSVTITAAIPPIPTKLEPLPPLPSIRPTIPLSQEILDLAAEYEANFTSTARLSFAIFKDSLLKEIDSKLFTNRPFKTRNASLSDITEDFESTQAARRLKRAAKKEQKIQAKLAAKQAANILVVQETEGAGLINLRKLSVLPASVSSQRNSFDSQAHRLSKTFESNGEKSDLRTVDEASTETANQKADQASSDASSLCDTESSSSLSDTESESLVEDDKDISAKALAETRLKSIDYEAENNMIQILLEQTHQEEIAAQASNTAYLDEKLDNLVAQNQEHNLDMQIAAKGLAIQAEQARMQTEEADRISQLAQAVLNDAEGEGKAYGYLRLDTLVRRTLPDSNLEEYAFHNELESLATLRWKERVVDKKFKMAYDKMTDEFINSYLVSEELELIVENLEKIQFSIITLLESLVVLTGSITQRKSLPHNFVEEVHSLVTTKIIPFTETIQTEIITSESEGVHPSTEMTKFLESAATFMNTVKATSFNLVTVAKYVPIFIGFEHDGGVGNSQVEIDGSSLGTSIVSRQFGSERRRSNPDDRDHSESLYAAVKLKKSTQLGSNFSGTPHSLSPAASYNRLVPTGTKNSTHPSRSGLFSKE